MHDRISILYNGKPYTGRRYLRMDDAGVVFQTVFYLDGNRSDPVGYARFAADDPAMNAVADGLLSDLVDAADLAYSARHGPLGHLASPSAAVQ